MKKLISALSAALMLCCTSVTAAAQGAEPVMLSGEGGFSPVWILIALGIGLVISLITMLVHKSKLKSVRMERSAGNYIKQGSVDINVRREMYLYKKVDRRQKPKNDNK